MTLMKTEIARTLTRHDKYLPFFPSLCIVLYAGSLGSAGPCFMMLAFFAAPPGCLVLAVEGSLRMVVLETLVTVVVRDPCGRPLADGRPLDEGRPLEDGRRPGCCDERDIVLLVLENV